MKKQNNQQIEDEKNISKRILHFAKQLRKEAADENLSYKKCEIKLGRYWGCHIQVLIEYENFLEE